MSRNEAKTVYYASIGPELALYDIDVDGAALIKRGAVTVPVTRKRRSRLTVLGWISRSWPISSRVRPAK